MSEKKFRVKKTDWVLNTLADGSQHRKWDLPAYKSPAFMDALRVSGLTMEQFKETDVYQSAVFDGLIVDDEWVGPDKGQW